MIADLAFVALVLAAAGWDLYSRTIPNALNLAVLLAGAVAMALAPEGGEPLMHLAHFGLALGACLALFALKVWGGGDAKFYAASALWFPLRDGLDFAVWTALSGAVLVVVFGVVGKLTAKSGWRRDLPYGVAIAAGGLVTMFAPRFF